MSDLPTAQLVTLCPCGQLLRRQGPRWACPCGRSFSADEVLEAGRQKLSDHLNGLYGHRPGKMAEFGSGLLVFAALEIGGNLYIDVAMGDELPFCVAVVRGMDSATTRRLFVGHAPDEPALFDLQRVSKGDVDA